MWPHQLALFNPGSRDLFLLFVWQPPLFIRVNWEAKLSLIVAQFHQKFSPPYFAGHLFASALNSPPAVAKNKAGCSQAPNRWCHPSRYFSFSISFLLWRVWCFASHLPMPLNLQSPFPLILPSRRVSLPAQSSNPDLPRLADATVFLKSESHMLPLIQI